MSKLFAVVLTVVVFSLGVLADETLKPTGWSWQKTNSSRQLGYVEGFGDGTQTEMAQRFCGDTKMPAMKATSICILFTLRQNTLLDVGPAETLSTISAFYKTPANLPVSWPHAVVISEALVSGVPVSDKDLEVIRKEDARLNVQ